jgi:hypothetical protein
VAQARRALGEHAARLIALGTFNHAIVSTIELVFGMRYGAAVSVGELFRNLAASCS